LGRLDKQVKIRGFRIEPGEVEAALEKHSAIQQAAIVVQGKDAEQKRLVAYLEATDLEASDLKSAKPEAAKSALDTTIAPSSVSPLKIRQFLLEKLPDYMVPAKFVWMESLPLTTNGKVNRRALPEPDWTSLQAEENLPQTELETVLTDTFSSLLPAETVGIHDNFFELGGDSIIAMQIVSRAAKAGIIISPKQLFQYQTIAELATVSDQGQHVPVSQAPATGEVPLTPIQHWFFEQNLAQPHHFNQSVYLSLPRDLDKAALEAAITHVFTHHDAFRLRFYQIEQARPEQDSSAQNEPTQRWKQAFSEEAVIPAIRWFDYTHLSSEKTAQEISQQIELQQTSLNLQDGPLFAICGFESDTNSPCHLFIAIHHLIIDGVSWRILLADVQQAYLQASTNQPIQFQSKTHSYQQWATELHDLATSSEIAADLDYWQALANKEWVDLPSDFTINAAENTVASSKTITVQLTEALTQSLLKEVPAAYNAQIADALLTAFIQTLTEWTNSSEILINLESYGRFSDKLDLSRSVGWFTALYPISLNYEPTLTLTENLKETQSRLSAVPNNGLSYGILNYLAADYLDENHLETDDLRATFNISAPVSFNYLGQIDIGQIEAHSEAGFKKISLPATSNKRNQADVNQRVHLLDVNSWIENDQLQIEWTFNQRCHKRETIETLAEQLVQNLSELIESCHLASCQTQQVVDQENVDQTPDDFSLVDLDASGLAAVLSQVSFSTENSAEQEVAS
ncbi:MAG: condensation domain-containing protein, partial [Cyanobacteria bacterium P01_D01_bin.105]